jgi:hypothetical protein
VISVFVSDFSLAVIEVLHANRRGKAPDVEKLQNIFHDSSFWKRYKHRKLCTITNLQASSYLMAHSLQFYVNPSWAPRRGFSCTPMFMSFQNNPTVRPSVVDLCIKQTNLIRLKKSNSMYVNILPSLPSHFSILNFFHDEVRLIPSCPVPIHPLHLFIYLFIYLIEMWLKTLEWN